MCHGRSGTEERNKCQTQTMVDRPALKAKTSAVESTLWRNAWQRYLKETGLDGHAAVTQLWECLSSETGVCVVAWETKDIAATRAACPKCTQKALSQPRDLPEQIQEPDYLQKLSANYFEVRGVQYLVVVDRNSRWPLVYKYTDLSAGELVRILRQVFTSYRVAEEFTSDEATVFTGHVFKGASSGVHCHGPDTEGVPPRAGGRPLTPWSMSWSTSPTW